MRLYFLKSVCKIRLYEVLKDGHIPYRSRRRGEVFDEGGCGIIAMAMTFQI